MIKMASKSVEQYYTIDEVANMLRVAYLTVYRWIQDDKIVAYKFGKQYRIEDKDFVIFKMKNKK